VRAAATFLVATLGALAGSANAAVDTPPRVTVIGDSVLTAVQWNPEPLSILQQGLDLRLDIGICRRLTGVSCPSDVDGERVPTLTDVVASRGPDLGRVVLVEVGYNDDHDTFAQSVEESVTALLRAGVQRILWANLHGFAQQWIDMNAVLDAAARRHPELTIIDWDSYSSPHWSWFQSDNLHLVYGGAVAMATLFHRAIDEVVNPVVINVAPLPVARVGHRYSARLTASGGVRPYSWRIVRGSLPKGLHLRPGGSIDGLPRRGGRVSIVVQATDSDGLAASRPANLRIDSDR
jgi:hypothetical protein